jgi:regulator of cell morphogenesis and NO signaling
MLFNENTKMADLIHANYLLLPILNRFDIQLGFGDLTVAEVCRIQKVNVIFFLEIINSFHDPDYFPQTNLQSFPLELIINYIKKSHSYYLEYKIPEIENLICQLSLMSDATSKKSFNLIEKFFMEYKEELIDHIQHEESNIYPYVLELDKAFLKDKIEESLTKRLKHHSINKFAKEHTNIEDKLYDLKNLIIKYIPPSNDYTLSNTLIVELFRLERDLNDHSRIEDKVLIPKVQKIEQALLNGGK